MPPRLSLHAHTLHLLYLYHSGSSRTFLSPAVWSKTKPFKRVHVLVQIDAFLKQQLPLVFFWHQFFHDRKLIAPLHQLVKAAQQDIHAVDESQIPQ